MPSDKQSQLLFATVIGLVTLWTGYLRAAGLNPHSLWYDDLWVASLAKLGSGLDAVSIAVPAPPAFIGALWISWRLVPDPELSLQLVPYLASLATIPLSAVLAARVSGSYPLGLLAGSLIALNPAITHYSVFVKQYAVDQLATTVLFLCAAMYFGTRKAGYLGTGATVGVGALFFSFPSVFASFVFVNLALLLHLRSIKSEPERTGPIIRTVLAFDIALVLAFVFVIVGRSNPGVVGFWRAGFLPLGSIDAAWGFLASRGLAAVRNALPQVLESALALVAIGVVWLLSRRSWRSFGFLTVLFYLAVIVASGLHLYPISGGPYDRPALARTDIFSYPVTILLFTLGAGAITSWLPKSAFVNASLTIAVLGLVIFKPARASYFPIDHSNYVRLMDTLAVEDDGILLWPSAGYLGGYYSTWPITATTRSDLDNQLEVHLDRPAALTLPWGPPAAMTAALETFITEGHYRRIIYLTTRAGDGQEDPVLASLERHGYLESQRWSSNVRTHLVVYQRVSSSSEHR